MNTPLKLMASCVVWFVVTLAYILTPSNGGDKDKLTGLGQFIGETFLLSIVVFIVSVFWWIWTL